MLWASACLKIRESARNHGEPRSEPPADEQRPRIRNVKIQSPALILLNPAIQFFVNVLLDQDRGRFPQSPPGGRFVTAPGRRQNPKTYQECGRTMKKTNGPLPESR